jgi:DNA-binding NtrC family response regulator
MRDETTHAATAPEGTDDPDRPARGYLIVKQRSGNTVIDVDEGAEIVVGRSSGATVRIDDPKASREHARFTRGGGMLRVVDLGSRNGTKINGRPLRAEPEPLASGDVVTIGAVDIVVAATAGPLVRRAGGPEGEAELPGVVVSDVAMVEVFERVRKVAAATTTVLVLGETGAGKDVVAEQIHRQSPRAGGPFIRLNCGSLPESLIESELFGHERGAFTGADKRKMGFVEAAHEGTLFLDEIGELGASSQTRLLRVLEDHKLTRLGGRDEIAVDIRVVAATNRDLDVESQRGRFRRDLYFRLSAFVIRIPPLRARPVEVELLAELFARQLGKRMSLPQPHLTPDALARLRGHDWPGNVRELRNAIEHAVVLAEGGPVLAEHLPDTVGDGRAGREPEPADGAMRALVAETERRAIQEALDAEDGNQTRAARRLGISRRALIYKLEKHGFKS